MYTGIRTQLEAGRISFLQGGSLANSTRKLVEEFSFSAVQFLATDWQLLLKALWPGEENPVQNLGWMHTTERRRPREGWDMDVNCD
jgi:hypothetical protein